MHTLPMSDPAELIILGGGCAGLSLALRLAELGPTCPRVIVLERRTDYVHDRTWSYWAGTSTRFSSLAQQTWQQLLIKSTGQTIRFDCGSMPYQSIASGDFYAMALATIRRNPRISIYQGASVQDPPQKVDGLWKVTWDNQTVQGRQIIDTRPDRIASGLSPALWQSFSGIELETSTNVFDDSAATLMEFIEGPQGQVSFAYILPYDRRRALIEATVFSPRRQGAEELAPLLAKIVSRYLGPVEAQTKHTECFAIPMGLPERTVGTDATYIHAGLEAGSARASTGYAFLRIQRWAESACLDLADGRLARPPDKDPWIIRRMDAVFLRVLSDTPERAPEVFARLFASNHPESVVRFLNDDAGPLDYIRIMCALPTGLFFRALLKTLRS